MSIGRIWRTVAVLVVVSLAVQLLPGVFDLPIGPRAAHADPITPTPPPAAVQPPHQMRVVETAGPTEAPSTITKDTVWSPHGSPYIVRGLTVAFNASLTLLPGTVVKVDWRDQIELRGQLLVLGTPDNRVTITSLRDDSVRGDTNGDGAATAPARGDWGGIHVVGGNPPFGPDHGPTTILDYVNLRYGGWSAAGCTGGQTLNVGSKGRAVVSNVRFSFSEGAGVRTYGLRQPGYLGIYNSLFESSACGVNVPDSTVDVVGNTFTSSLGIAMRAIEPAGVRFWFNTAEKSVEIENVQSPPPTAAKATARYNILLGGFSEPSSFNRELTDWSANWFGRNANEVLPACLDPAAAGVYYPRIRTTASTECPAGQVKVLGYLSGVTPALSASPQVLPEFAREAAAPRFGPVNTYTGALTYQSEDLGIEDAGKTVTATRTYRSDRLRGGDVGQGWTSAFSEALSDNGGVTTMSFGDGSGLGFVTDPASGYIPTPGVSASFTRGGGGTTVGTPGQTGYEFNPSGELTGLTLGDPGHRIDVQRSNGQVSRVTGVSGRYLSYGRSSGKLNTVADNTGRQVSFGYTGARLTSAVGVDGHSETYGYESNGRLLHVITPEGRVKLAASYDAEGRVTWIEQQGSGRTTFTYDDPNGRRVITLPDSTTITQEYDFAGRLVTERVGGTGTHVVYDGEGRVISQITGVPSVAMEGYGPAAPVTVYDGKGDPVLSVDPFGRHASTTFDSGHRPLVSTRADGSTIRRTYDGVGRLSTVTDPRGKVWTYTYNSRGQITTQRNPLQQTRSVSYAANGDASSTTDETNATTLFGYDTLGRRVSVTDPLDHVATRTYTSWGAPATITSARAGITTIEYNRDRQQTSVTGPTGAVTRYEFDSAGRLSAMVDALGGRTVTSYDNRGRAVTVTDARGSVLRQTYTPEGWVGTTTDPAGAVTTYAHDPAGRLYRLTDPLGQTTQRAYGRSGRLTKVWQPDGGLTSYGYDSMGRQRTVTTPRGHIWTTEYDAAGQPTKLTDPLANSVSTGYDDIGRPVSRTDQLGVVTTFSFNETLRTAAAADPLGTITTVTRDAAGRIVAETDGAGGTTSYGYDADGNLTSTTDPAGTWRYEYDLAGRLTATIDPVNRRTTAGYDPLGRLTGRTHPDTTTEAFTYDAVGNLTRHTDRVGSQKVYAFDAANRVTTATDPLGGNTTFGYDQLGRRTSMTDPSGVVSYYAYDPMGRAAVRWDATGASWVTLYDLDGNVRRTIDPAGVQWTFSHNDRG